MKQINEFTKSSKPKWYILTCNDINISSVKCEIIFLIFLIFDCKILCCMQILN
uniref:Uncharacterized protein n=1 Tax=Octopus bimaculoides TaxID=37653 RepID=A0A0L8G813_OCTBM